MPAAAATVTVTDNASDTANVDVSCTHTRRRYSSASDSSDSYTLATDDEELESLAGASDVSSDGFEWVVCVPFTLIA
ncbi:hypothetical protein Dda_7514 [Drechslerella dactyloides]|uniref:Uncharacterized protein n=1 Tax=Drechslerella dactyloides TaxID=74499 RepID=A0AAD6NFM6_DREDA|nr:hypothetical protein Dda_7514 [Drechslerella dactyloides]